MTLDLVGRQLAGGRDDNVFTRMPARLRNLLELRELRNVDLTFR